MKKHVAGPEWEKLPTKFKKMLTAFGRASGSMSWIGSYMPEDRERISQEYNEQCEKAAAEINRLLLKN